MTNASDNAAIEKTYVEKQQIQVNTMLDGQIRELDKPFEAAGGKVMYPSVFAIASEDIHCRCALLQRAKWTLDEDELQTLKERASYFGLDKTKDFEGFKSKYLEYISK